MYNAEIRILLAGAKNLDEAAALADAFVDRLQAEHLGASFYGRGGIGYGAIADISVEAVAAKRTDSITTENFRPAGVGDCEHGLRLN